MDSCFLIVIKLLYFLKGYFYEKIIKCEKQKKCIIYIDMTNYKDDEAKLVVEAPERLISTLNGKGGILG